MLTRTAAFLGIQRGSIFGLAKFAMPHRHLCENHHENDETGVKKTSVKFNVDDFKDMLKTEEDRKKCHLILLEISSIHEDTGRAPTEVRRRDMQDLLLSSLFQRRKYYEYMFKREQSKKNGEEKKAILRLSREERLKNSPREAPDVLYPFIRQQAMFNNLNGRRLAEAALFSQKIIFDYSYEDHMSNREKRNLAEQIQLSYAVNKVHPFPFDITICNLEKGGFCEGLLQQYFATDDLRRMLIGTTDKSYLDLFPKEDLIYLSPNSPFPLQEWDHSKTLIIGALVDLGPERPLSLAQAKKHGIATARFPLMEHVCLQSGAQKTLTLNNTFEILLEMKMKNNWSEALKKLPRRIVAKVGPSSGVQRTRILNKARRESFVQRS